MKQELIYTAILIIIASSLPGLNFKDFPLGCYSYLGNEKYVYDNREDMIDAMHDLGYNSNILEIHSPHTSDTFNAYSDYGDLFTKLSEQNIGFVIMDKRWDIDKQFSTYPLSTSSYYQFEAKYNNDAEIVTGDLQHSEKWYTTREKHGLERIGHLDNNGYWWECIPEQDDPGYAYTDLFYRWQNASGDSIRIGQEFLIKRPIDSNIDDHYIYITYNFHIESVRIGLDLDFPLVSFHPCGYRYYNNDPNTWYESTPRPLAHTNMTNLTVGEQTDFTWGDYLNLPSPTDEINVTIKISYNDLMADSLLWYGSWSHWNLVNLNPRMYWHDNCELSLKSVEIEDQLYHDIVMNSSLAQSIGNQISDFPSSSNGFQGIYSLDEPMQGQWEAYKVIQDAMPTGLEFMTASYDKHYRKFPMVADSVYTVGPNTEYYDNIKAFTKITAPNIIMPDIYPFRPDNASVTLNDEEGFQKVLDDKLIKVYDAAKKYASGDGSRLFYPVVQSFGHWDTDNWISWILPPHETQKMLQLIPLCFDPDGILNYRLFGYQTCNSINFEVSGDYAPLISRKFVNGTPYAYDNDEYYSRYGDQPDSRSSYNAPVEFPLTYEPIQEANKKISKYIECIKGIGEGERYIWKGSSTIGLTGAEADTVLFDMNLTDLKVQNQQNQSLYQGFVQCGYYLDNNSNPAFMIVNRRTNYLPIGISPATIPVSQYNVKYMDFDAQNVAFDLLGETSSTYGTYTALFDSYDEETYIHSNAKVIVPIDPGDGKYLQMCATLPSLVNADAQLSKLAYLSGSITIDDSAEVTIHAGTQTTILPHSTIMVRGGSILNLAGIVTIKDTVNIIVEEGSSINFNGAICIWGYGSGITIDASEITATNSIFLSNNQSQGWEGIHVSNNSTISLDDTEINGAASNTVYNSNVYLSDCIINVPANSIGLHIDNWTASYDVRISATVDGKGFFGKGLPAYGLAYGNQCNSTFIAKTCFKDLTVGLENLCNLAVRDTIINCGFMDNERGIRIASNQFSPYIYTCNFVDNEIGIDLDLGASPEISNCTFDNCEIGIKTEMSSASSGGIYDCIFTSSALHRSRFGIVSRGSNLRVADNKFYTNYGILNHSGSILNMGNTAKNLFHAKIANFKFRDTVTYNAYVQLYLGHNDFYHENQGLIPTHDFQFDSNWYVPVPPKSNALNVSYNWFEDSIVEIVCPPGGIPTKYVRYTELDPSPNVFLEVYERMALALASEKQGDYVVANDTYRAILDEDLDAESTIMLDALDAYYRTSALVGDAPSETQAYLIAKTNQYAADNPLLTKYAEDYTVKSYLNIKDYQAAIDMIQVRLTDPESEIDSLLAVMDLEIVLQLAAMDQSKRPITTKYTQYIYPNRKVYNARHAEHWDKLNQLYNTEEDLVPIPNSSVISSNYPNPFNPSTTISYSIPEDSRVKLTIFNIKGQKIKDLVSENMLRGHHKFVWDGRDDGNRKVSSGIYFVKLEAAGNSYTHKMMLMK